MKRLHVHVSVKDLSESVRFYSTLFAAEPTVLKDDYAKWMLEDPLVNFAISTHRQAAGVDHLGIQVENEQELAEVYGRLSQAQRPVLEQGETTCCYARSEKAWITDPQGLYWETFHSLGEAPVYGEDSLVEDKAEGACTTEIAAFDEFAGLLAGSEQQGEFDHIVFDTAPTGHTLRLLRLPAAWSGFLETHVEGES